MKPFPAFATLAWVCIVASATTAQAGPAQPVIQLPQRAAVGGPTSGPAATENLDPDLGRKLALTGACLGEGTG